MNVLTAAKRVTATAKTSGMTGHSTSIAHTSAKTRTTNHTLTMMRGRVNATSVQNVAKCQEIALIQSAQKRVPAPNVGTVAVEIHIRMNQ